MKNVYYPIILLSALLSQSCTSLQPAFDLSVSNNISAVKFIQERSDSIISIRADMNIDPSGTTRSFESYLDYSRDGTFRLVGLSPSGFTMFDIKIAGGVATGTITEFPDNAVFKPHILPEVIDFYGSEMPGDTTWFIEELGNYYLVSQLAARGGLSYPKRRWWIDRSEMVIVKKELYSDISDGPGERLFGALYRDFRPVDDVMTPHEIILNDGAGNRLGKIRFNRIEFKWHRTDNEGTGD